LTIITGWGSSLKEFVDLPVINKAIGGRSARSYTVEGRFQEVAKLVAPGDWVVIEFGHNDGGTLNANNDNGRTDCPGEGSKTCPANYKGQTSAKTFPAYMTDAGKLMAGKGAKVVMSSMTPNNPWESGKFVYTSSRFATYAKDSAKAVGESAFYVDHGTYTAKAMEAIGKSKTDDYFQRPGGKDHTHTNAKGAEFVAKQFAKAVACAKIPLSQHVKREITC
jgi:rhamnogalacturonan acetylesterase